MRILYFLPFLLLASCFSEEKVDIGSSNTFIRYYNGGFNDEPVTIAKTIDDGYIILSNMTLNDGRYKIKLIKTDDQGNSLWTKIYPNFNATRDDPERPSQRAFGLLVQANGSYVLAGEDINVTSNSSQVLVMVINSDGGKTSERIYASAASVRGIAIKENIVPIDPTKPGYILLGSVLSGDTDNIVVGGIGSDLSPLWNRTYGNGESNLTNKIFQDTKGTLYFGGTVTRQNKSDIRLVITPQDSEGAISDPRIGSPDFNEFGTDICRYGFGFAVVGSTNKNGDRDILFQRLAEDGEQIGEPITFPVKTVDGTEVPGNKGGNAISVTQDGGLLLAGTVPSDESLNFGRGETDLYLIKIDAFGTVTWQKDIGSRNADRSVATLQADDGGYVVLASTTLAGLKTTMLLKTDKNGNIQ